MAQNSAAVTSVSGSTSAVTLFAATGGADTLNRTVFNDSAADLYVKYGAAASTTDFTVKVPVGGYWEAPAPVFDGLITGVWSSAVGAARCTQVSA